MKPNYTLTAKSRSVLLHLLFLLAAVGLPACKPQQQVVVETSPVGTYKLVSIDGNTVPCTLKHEGATPTIKSGSFVINGDGTCSSKVVFSMPQQGDATREVKASYTRQGAKLTMNWEGAGTTMGAIAGESFTMTNEGMVFAYRK
jgi:hypothetical protein